MPKQKQEQEQELISAGVLFIMAAGEYSDFRVKGLFRTLREINPDKEIEKDVEHSRLASITREDKTLARLLVEGAIEEVEHTEWWVQ